MEPPTEPWLTKKEVANCLRISTRTVTRLRLPFTRVGGQNRYRMSEVEACLNGLPPKGGEVIPIRRGVKRN